jgi:hypothetical protein
MLYLFLIFVASISYGIDVTINVVTNALFK